jgi:SAM-dependent methyltransferase
MFPERRVSRDRHVRSLAVKKDYFGEEVAERYDDGGPMFSPEVVGPTVDFLAALAGEGAAVEFGIGPGRVALPHAQRGVRVHGIDLSEAMVARLREKPGSEQIVATIGDFATVRVEGTFSLVYLVFNTICNLTTQDDQVACFQNAADHLEPGGFFVIEVGTPDLQRLSPGERFYPFEVSSDHIGLDEHDIANQGLVSHHLWPGGGAWHKSSVPFRYVWPAELDLMARLAGMRLRERWEDWGRSPFTSESRKHVSVWERAG